MSLSPAGNGIGQPVRRREDLRLLTGRGRYSDDINVPGQAYAVMVRSPHAHALIRVDRHCRGDARAWRARRADRSRHAGRRTEADPARRAHRSSGGHQARERGRLAAIHSAALSDGHRRGAPCRRHRRHGDRNQPHRGKGCRGTGRWWTTPICLRWFTRDRRWRRMRRARGRTPHRISASMPRWATRARPTRRSRRAAHVVRFSTSVQRIAGVTMEPRAAVGEYDATTGRYTLHAGAGGAVRPAARHWPWCSASPDEDVRMVMHDVGGNFGTRGASNPEFALVAWAARRVGRAGEMDLRTQRGVPVRLPGARSDRRCRTRAGCARENSWPCAAPTWSTAARIPSRSARCTRAWRS